MKKIYERILALFILCIPGAIAVYGWTLIRNAFFSTLIGQKKSLLILFIGCMLVILGVSFIAGFIFHHDRKRNKIQPKLLRQHKE